MSRDFKVGDRVRLTRPVTTYGLRAGDQGTVREVGASTLVATVPGGAAYLYKIEVEHVEPEPQFRKGDRVRVTFEAEYHRDATIGHYLSNGAVYVSNRVDNLDIVKMQDPFQPGDIVREKSSDRLFVLGKDGYFQWTPTVGPFVDYEDGGAVSGIEGSFPSNDPDYEKVEVPLD